MLCFSLSRLLPVVGKTPRVSSSPCLLISRKATLEIKDTTGGFETLHRRGTGAAHSAPEGLYPPRRDITLSLRAYQLPVTSYQLSRRTLKEVII